MDQELQDLQKQIDELKIKRAERHLSLDQSFLNLLELHSSLQDISRVKIHSTANSVLDLLKTNQLAIVFQFLGFKDILKLRLLSRSLCQAGKNSFTLIHERQQQQILRLTEEIQKIQEEQAQPGGVEQTPEAIAQQQQALQGLQQLSKTDVQVVKSFARPPLVVFRIMYVVMVLIDPQAKPVQETPENAWPKIKIALNDSQFIGKFISLDIHSITSSSGKYDFIHTIDDISQQQAESISSACGGFLQFLRSIQAIGQVPTFKLQREIHQKQSQLAKLSKKVQHWEKLIKKND